MNNKMAIHIYQQLNLKNKINKQAETDFIHTENVLTVARLAVGGPVGGIAETGDGIKK